MDNDDYSEYIEYGIILVLIVVLVWMFMQKANLQTLYDQSITTQAQLRNQLASQTSADNAQIASLKKQLDDLNAQIASLKPKADELAQYKSIISSNLYLSLQASNALFGTTSNPQLLQQIASLTSDVVTKSGLALCDVAQILAKILVKSYDANSQKINKELCNPSAKAQLVSFLNNNGEFANSSVVLLIIAVFDLFQAYFCTNQTNDNFNKIVTAMVNVICNPSNESKQLFSALYKQMLFDLDNNYKNGSPALKSNPGVYTPGQTYTQPSWSDGRFTYPSHTYTTQGYYLPSATGDPIIDKLAENMRITYSL